MNRSASLLGAFFLAVALTACSESISQELPTVATQGQFAVRLAITDEIKSEVGSDPALIMQAMQATISDLGEAVGEEHDWVHARRAAQAYLEAPGASARGLREQAAAAYMLRTHLLPSPDAEQQIWTAHYVRLLVENESPEGNLVAEALVAAGSELTADERIRLASQAASALRKVLDKQMHCAPNCASTEVIDQLSRRGVELEANPAYATVRALAELERLAAN